MERHTLELSLDRLEIAGADKIIRKNGKHILSVSLVWPRPMIDERVALKTIELEERAADFAGAAWSERVLFKERIEGPFGIAVSFSESMTAGQIRRFILETGSAIFKLAGSEAGDAVTGAMASGLLTLPFKLLSKELAGQAKDSIRWIGEGVHDETGNPRKSGWTVKVPLTVPETITSVRRRRRGGRVRHDREVLAEKGVVLGTVMMRARYYG